jgi:ubiquinone/menaquinone biosynthesis C-methylase UbiE
VGAACRRSVRGAPTPIRSLPSLLDVARVRTARPRLTGERPRRGVTPDSLVSLHDAGYVAVVDRLAAGKVLDVGCGEGFETVRLAAPLRSVVGVDYSPSALSAAAAPDAAAAGVAFACMDAVALAVPDGAFDAVCSSHLIEHFTQPETHVAEMARVLRADGTAFVLTPNAPTDFENPFHVRLFGPADLEELLRGSFFDVEVLGLDASALVKADFARRRAKAARVLRLDVLDLRHHVPRRWYLAFYTRVLPLAYRVLAARDDHGATGITAEEWFVSDHVDDTTPVLFALCRGPRPAGIASPPVPTAAGGDPPGAGPTDGAGR